jgi:hypothetical protein
VLEAVLNVAVLAGILGAAALGTHLFTRAMYLRCSSCKTLNAKRRSHCRSCGRLLRD